LVLIEKVPDFRRLGGRADDEKRLGASGARHDPALLDSRARTREPMRPRCQRVLRLHSRQREQHEELAGLILVEDVDVSWLGELDTEVEAVAGPEGASIAEREFQVPSNTGELDGKRSGSR
jgi:hypothetical protein